MLSAGRDELLCDLAETYHIYSFQALPASTLAVLASGLGDNSRIKRKLSGVNGVRMEKLLALAVDRLSWLVYTKTDDAQKGINKPVSIYDALFARETKNDEPLQSFEDYSGFAAAWKNLNGGGA